MKSKKQFALVLAVLMLTGLLAACGSTSETFAAADNMAVESPRSEAAEVAEEGKLLYSETADSSTGSALSENQKLIKRVNIDAETEDLEAVLSDLSQQINELGGYVENQEIYNGSSYSSYRSRSASLTIRIPAENLDSFVGQVKGISNVVNYNESAEDVTLTYVSTESRIIALETEQERLLELLSKAENMTDLLKIEERLTEVRYELENVTSQLRVLSNKVSYATIYLSIEQVEVFTELEEPTVWQRITNGFSDNLQDIGDGLVDFLVWVITYSPQLLFWAVIIAVVVVIVKRAVKKRKEVSIPPYYPPEKNGEDKK